MANNQMFQDLGVRVITALGLIVLVVVVYGFSGYGFTLLFTILWLILSVMELGAMFHRMPAKYFIGVIWALVIFLFVQYNALLWSVFVGLLLLGILIYKRYYPKNKVLFILAVTYVTLAISAFFRFYTLFGGYIVLKFLLLIAVIDISAYFIGRIVRGKKLIPRISPKKTVSGFIGAIVIACIVGGGLFFNEFQWTAFLFALCLSLVSQGGDLLESWLKRKRNIKDSGAILPGHGGLLDRFDGVLAAAYILGIWMWFIS